MTQSRVGSYESLLEVAQDLMCHDDNATQGRDGRGLVPELLSVVPVISGQQSPQYVSSCVGQ